MELGEGARHIRCIRIHLRSTPANVTILILLLLLLLSSHNPKMELTDRQKFTHPCDQPSDYS